MNLLQYSPWSLSGTVHLMANQMLSQCPIMGRFFTRHVGQDAINVSWDVVTGTASIMRGLRVHSPGQIGAQVNEKTISARLPKFHEIRPVEIDGLLTQRRLGDQSRGSRRAKGKITLEQKDLVAKYVRTLKYMGAQSLKGSITLVNEHGNEFILAEWDLPAANKPDRYTGEQAWTHDESDPKQDVTNLKVVIQQSTRKDPEKWCLLAGTGVINALQKNKSLKGDGKRLTNKQVAEQLEIDEVVHYPDTYLSEDGSTWTELVGSDEFVLVGYSPEFYSVLYLYLNDILETAGAMAGDMDAKMKNSDVDKLIVASECYLRRNPRIAEVSLESYAMPVCHAPGSTAFVKPIAAK